MNKYLIGSVVGILLVIGIFYSGMKYESFSAQRAADKQALKESEAAGTIAAGDVKHEHETTASIERLRKVEDPTGCITTRMPDSVIREHGGVHKPTP